MKNYFNIYCDESCHLENDHIKSMALGAIWCHTDDAAQISHNIKSIKKKYNLSNNFEIKWTKISPAKKNFYFDLIEYFFTEPRLHFRGVVIPDKKKLNHDKFDQSHDDWYYKMYFLLIKGILSQKHGYNIYIDIKDTRGTEKVKKLHEVLCNSKYDFDKNIIKNIQQIRSHEVTMMQIADLFIGAITYHYRGLQTSSTKLEFIDLLKKLSKHSLDKSTLPREEKFNLFVWNPNNGG